MIDLRQGASAARALRDEQALQTRLVSAQNGQTPMAEAKELIAQVLNRPDTMEQAEILADIDRGLTRADVAENLAEQGFGPAVKSTTTAVLARLRAQLQPLQGPQHEIPAR